LIVGAAVNGPSDGHTEARFDGGVAELALFARALAPEEIASLR
jgi:hypothetical protein